MLFGFQLVLEAVDPHPGSRRAAGVELRLSEEAHREDATNSIAEGVLEALRRLVLEVMVLEAVDPHLGIQ